MAGHMARVHITIQMVTNIQELGFKISRKVTAKKYGRTAEITRVNTITAKSTELGHFPGAMGPNILENLKTITSQDKVNNIGQMGEHMKDNGWTIKWKVKVF